MGNKISALIAARSGSLRVKNKNIREFSGSNLLELKINQLKQVDNIDEIVVNSNCDEILNIAKKHNVHTIKRDGYYASNTVSMSEVFENMAKNIDNDYILYANCTNPLVETQTYFDSINTFFEQEEQYDSLVSCHDITI